MSDVDDKVNNDLKQFSKSDQKVIESIEQLAKIERLTVRKADFKTGKVTVKINDVDPSHEGVMNAVKFCAISDRMEVQSVDFDTAEIVVKWVPDLIFDLAEDEIAFIKNRQLIYAIKAIRQRTGMGLAEAKDLAQKHQREIMNGDY